VDRGAHPSRPTAGVAASSLPSRQESQAVDQTPDRSRQRFRIGAGIALLHTAAEIFRDGGGRCDPFTAVAVAGLCEHRPKQRRPIQRELDLSDSNHRNVIGG
jgi:hypothetical protein